MTMAISQHWIPQFYLRAFSTSPKGKKIAVTDIKRTYSGAYAAEPKPIAAVACQDHLYSYPLEGDDFHPDKPHPKDPGWDDRLEREFGTIEAETGKLWVRLAEDPQAIDFSRDSQERETLSIFLANLHLRNRRMIAVAKVAQRAEELPDLDTPAGKDAFHAATEETLVNMDATLEGLQDRLPFRRVQDDYLSVTSKAIARLHWKLHYFPGNAAAGPLFTSDTPVFFVDSKTWEATTLESPTCVLICSLTSRVLLMATAQRTTATDGEMSIEDLKLPQSNAFVLQMNQFIIHYGTNEAYSGKAPGPQFPFLR